MKVDGLFLTLRWCSEGALVSTTSTPFQTKLHPTPAGTAGGQRERSLGSSNPGLPAKERTNEAEEEKKYIDPVLPGST